MKQALQKNQKMEPSQMMHRVREGLFLFSLAVSFFMLISFVSFHASDPGWSNTGIGHTVLNWGGKVGAFLADVLLSLLGFMAYLLPPLMIFGAWVGAYREQDSEFNIDDFIFKFLGFAFIILGGCGLSTFYFKQHFSFLPVTAGGILGDVIGNSLAHIFNLTGSALFLITAFLCGVTLFTGFSWIALIDKLGARCFKIIEWIRKSKKESSPEKKTSSAEKFDLANKKIIPQRLEPQLVEAVMPVISKPKLTDKKIEKKIVSATVVPSGALPPLILLNPPSVVHDKAFSQTSFEELSLLVEQRLLDFGVEVKVVAVHPGPVITRFSYR